MRKQNALRARKRSSLSTATAFIKRRETYRIAPRVSIVVLSVVDAANVGLVDGKRQRVCDSSRDSARVWLNFLGVSRYSCSPTTG